MGECTNKLKKNCTCGKVILFYPFLKANNNFGGRLGDPQQMPAYARFGRIAVPTAVPVNVGAENLPGLA